MSKIKNIRALEVLDSRGNPTIQVEVWTENNGYGKALVPSGASTGTKEALELRDQDPKRYLGKGVLKAVSNVNDIIAENIIGWEAQHQKLVDDALIKLDGTENKTVLGANAILGVSMAVMKAAADELNIELYKHIANIAEMEPKKLPVPMLNIINGGEHADNTIDFQEFMIMPVSAKTFKEAIRISAEIFHTLKKILHNKGMTTAVGDEGGFAPDLDNESALEVIMEAIKQAGYEPNRDIKIAMDCAASELYDVERKLYIFKKISKKTGKEVIKTTDEMITFLEELVNKYPIISIEDGLSEHDWEGFIKLTNKIGNRVQIVGDDLFVTNPKITSEGINKKAANSVLIKVNQIGTISETIDTILMAKKANWTAVVSHRSGETEDTTIADLAVGLNTGQIKTGSMSRTDRIAKYNRLLTIEHILGENAEYDGIKSFYNLKDI